MLTYRPGKENITADALSRKLEDVKSQKAVKEALRTRILWSLTLMLDPVTIKPITRSQARAQQPTPVPRRRIEVRIPPHRVSREAEAEIRGREPSPTVRIPTPIIVNAPTGLISENRRLPAPPVESREIEPEAEPKADPEVRPATGLTPESNDGPNFNRPIED